MPAPYQDDAGIACLDTHSDGTTCEWSSLLLPQNCPCVLIITITVVVVVVSYSIFVFSLMDGEDAVCCVNVYHLVVM